MEIINQKFDEVYKSFDLLNDFNKTYSAKKLGIKGTGKHKVNKTLANKIIKKYFEIFLKEHYYIGNCSYFLFGGTFQLATVKDRVIKKNNKKRVHKTGFVFHWYDRPSIALSNNFVSLIRLTGSTNLVPSIEKQYLLNNSYDKFSNLAEVRKKMGYVDFKTFNKL